MKRKRLVLKPSLKRPLVSFAVAAAALWFAYYYELHPVGRDRVSGNLVAAAVFGVAGCLDLWGSFRRLVVTREGLEFCEFRTVSRMRWSEIGGFEAVENMTLLGPSARGGRVYMTVQPGPGSHPLPSFVGNGPSARKVALPSLYGASSAATLANLLNRRLQRYGPKDDAEQGSGHEPPEARPGAAELYASREPGDPELYASREPGDPELHASPGPGPQDWQPGSLFRPWSDEPQPPAPPA